MLNIGVLISGGGTNLQTIIDGCISKEINAQIKVVISSNEKAYGLERCRKYNIEAYYEKDENNIIKIFKDKKIDLVILAGYIRIMSPKFIGMYRNRMINIHPSLIPSFCGKGYYGENVHRGVLEYGVKVTGATVHFVDEGTDTGPIIMQEVVKVLDDDSVESLAKRVLEVEHKILKESIRLFCDNKVKVQGRRVFISE